MPCIDPRDRSDAILNEDRLDRATRAACDAMRALKEIGAWAAVSQETLEWWEKHKYLDAKRKAS